MENSKRVLNAIVSLLVVSLGACAQSANLVLLQTNSDFASYADYYESNNMLLYFGVSVNETGRITGSLICTRNLKTGSETVLEENTAFPATGWINDSTILIDKILASPGKSLFSNEHQRVLYLLNIHSLQKEIITEIPLPGTSTELITGDNLIIYQTGFGPSARCFKYDVQSRKTTELSILAGLEIADGNIAYHSTTQMLGFVYFFNEEYHLNLFHEGQLRTIEHSSKYIDHLSFDSRGTQLYYVARNGKNSEKQILKSVNLTNLSINTRFDFMEPETPVKIDSYENGCVIVSMESAPDLLSKHELSLPDEKIAVGINPKRKVFILCPQN
jgi:hypothetical protein